jgi:hypothetical protein
VYYSEEIGEKKAPKKSQSLVDRDKQLAALKKKLKQVSPSASIIQDLHQLAAFFITKYLYTQTLTKQSRMLNINPSKIQKVGLTSLSMAIMLFLHCTTFTHKKADTSAH